MTGSNRRPPACKAGALPAELIPQTDLQTMPDRRFEWLVGLVGFEPTTPALSRGCSNRLSYRPTHSSCASPRSSCIRPLFPETLPTLSRLTLASSISPHCCQLCSPHPTFAVAVACQHQFNTHCCFSSQPIRVGARIRAPFLASTTTHALGFSLRLSPSASPALHKSRFRDFQKGGDPAAPSDTATLLRLHPSHEPCRGNRPPCG